MNAHPFVHITRAYRRHKLDAHEAYALFVDYCGGHAPPRVAGMDTVVRLATRIHHGRTITEAAAAEYLYRWRLAIKSPDQCGATGVWSRDPMQRHLDRDPRACVSIFGTPHAIGL